MHIQLNPQSRTDITLDTLAKSGDVLEVNGVPFDFSVLPPKHTLSADAFAGDLVLSARRDFDGELTVVILLPYADPDAPSEVRFPEVIIAASDGAIGVPGNV